METPCNSKYTFANHNGRCVACCNAISIDEVITISGASPNKDVWVHYDCANKILLESPDKPIQCLKCLSHIFEFEEKEPSSFGSRVGYKHKTCPTSSTSRPFKRRMEVLDQNPVTTAIAEPLTELQEHVYTSSHALRGDV